MISRKDLEEICREFKVECRFHDKETFEMRTLYSFKEKVFKPYEIYVPKENILEAMCRKRMLKSKEDCLEYFKMNIEHEVKHAEKETEILRKCNELLYLYKTTPTIIRHVENACEDVAIEKELELKYSRIFHTQCIPHIERNIKSIVSEIERIIGEKKDFTNFLNMAVTYVSCFAETKLIDALTKANISSEVKEILKNIVNVLVELRESKATLCDCVVKVLYNTLRLISTKYS